MVIDYPKIPHQRGPRKEGEAAASQAEEAGKHDACRCKETSKMTPRELLNLMFNDLAFWKKPGKE